MSKMRFLMGSGLLLCGLYLLIGSFPTTRAQDQKPNPFSRANKLDDAAKKGETNNPFAKKFELSATPQDTGNPFDIKNKIVAEATKKVAKADTTNPFAEKFRLQSGAPQVLSPKLASRIDRAIKGLSVELRKDLKEAVRDLKTDLKKAIQKQLAEADAKLKREIQGTSTNQNDPPPTKATQKIKPVDLPKFETYVKVKETEEGSDFEKRITYAPQFDKQRVAPGEVITLTVKAKLPEEKYYTFPAAEEHWVNDKIQAKTEFLFYFAESESSVGEEAAAKRFQSKVETVLIREPEPKLKKDELLGKDYYILPKSPVTYEVKLRVSPKAEPGVIPAALVIKSQVCEPGRCYQGKSHVHLFNIVVLNQEAKKLSGDLKAQIEEQKKRADAARTTPDKKKSQMGLLTLMGWAAAGAVLMLLTPCVFPMIPVTVNFFLKQSESKTYNGPLMASVYSGTIFGVLSIVIIFFLSFAIWLAAAWWFNLLLGFVLIFFALSLFGLYELELPSFMVKYTASREGQGGLIGAVFMALTFTITSFSCTGPFLGLLVAGYAGTGQEGISLLHLIVGAMTYAFVFALPFFLLALFPALLKTLPKSGGWLNTIKVSMGFVELAAALKFLSLADAYWFPGDPLIFTYDTVLISWIVLSGLCGVYLIGLFRLPHDDVQDRVGVIRMFFGSIFLGLAMLMMPMLLGRTPAGIVGSTVEAILPQNFKPFNTGGGSTTSDSEWTKDYEEARKQALREGRPMFLDFTGQNCANCRLNEKNVFSRPDVRKRLDQFVGVQLYTDTVPKVGFSPSKAKEEANRNVRWQRKLATPALPSYVLFRPDPKEPFTKDGYPKGEIIAPNGQRYVDGAINDIQAFQNWLEQGAEIGREKMKADQPTVPKKAKEPKQTAQAK